MVSDLQGQARLSQSASGWVGSGWLKKAESEAKLSLQKIYTNLYTGTHFWMQKCTSKLGIFNIFVAEYQKGSKFDYMY